MEKIIKLGIPHVAELVFDSFDTSDLINYMEVSETWKVLAENVLIKRCKRWKGKIFEACKTSTVFEITEKGRIIKIWA